ncbi:hypothetical protein MMC14_002669 [Varicellaria rhodocarpa]|nr:hypothetical protein [Varicellaria rhodocarpa]
MLFSILATVLLTSLASLQGVAAQEPTAGGYAAAAATSPTTLASSPVPTLPPQTTSRTPKQSLKIAQNSASYFSGVITSAEWHSFTTELGTVVPTETLISYTFDYLNIVSIYATQTPVPAWETDLTPAGQSFFSSIGVAERSYQAKGYASDAPRERTVGVWALGLGLMAGVIGMLMM